MRIPHDGGMYAVAVREFDLRVGVVGVGQWCEPTPCAGWDVRALKPIWRAGW